MDGANAQPRRDRLAHQERRDEDLERRKLPREMYEIEQVELRLLAVVGRWAAELLERVIREEEAQQVGGLGVAKPVSRTVAVIRFRLFAFRGSRSLFGRHDDQSRGARASPHR